MKLALPEGSAACCCRKRWSFEFGTFVREHWTFVRSKSLDNHDGHGILIQMENSNAAMQ